MLYAFLAPCKLSLLSAFPSSHCSQPDISSLFVTTYFSSGSGSQHSHVLVKFGTRDKKVWAEDWPATGDRIPVLVAAFKKYQSMIQDVFLGRMKNPQARCLILSKTAQLFFSRQHINSSLYTNIIYFPSLSFRTPAHSAATQMSGFCSWSSVYLNPYWFIGGSWSSQIF